MSPEFQKAFKYGIRAFLIFVGIVLFGDLVNYLVNVPYWPVQLAGWALGIGGGAGFIVFIISYAIQHDIP